MNIKYKRFMFASIVASVWLSVAIKSIIIWEFANLLSISPWCLGYLAAFSGFDSWKPTKP